ncbi:39S ribosomal protein L17, mitochondrial [Protobothrops mucrosquamatus]|uniref:39S ribosomal protein L17, mitochondrial n=1 Tax=Protobothrops mucrosquamatus TaxID=103944 RepID=UPI000775EF8A|nr:39S ribosomal protein L17, mitochondrial [Protobothrops mucrosquamatus]
MRLTAVLGISHGRLRRRLGFGPRSRLDLLRNLVTGLVRHERIETTRARADEMRFYAEQLIEHAKRGDTDPQAMRLADFWLTEKDLLPKLFQVLAPRFAPHQGGYTRMVRIPKNDNLDRAERAVIEYKGNPLPPLPLPRRDGEKTLVNQLLKGYREERRPADGTAV